MSETIKFTRTRKHIEDRNMPRIRSMKEAHAYIKTKDPNTSISFFAFRRDVLNGSIPSRKNGSRYYVDLNEIEQYYK